MNPSIQPGLLILHGNRLELLAETTFAWLTAHPLGPLEEENFLVQSNGMGEWLKMELASAQGICAAARVDLPARFIWRAYRAVLGRSAVPAVPALDKLPLTWRLMGLLPELAGQPGFEPVKGFLGEGDPARRLQLAQRLADLFDQYQVYRSDWLQDWEQGLDRIRSDAMAGPACASPVPSEQCWQPALWRAAVESLKGQEQAATRAVLHQRFLAALQAPDGKTDGTPASWPQLPRRVVLFGTTHIPHQTLEAIAALSEHTQVLMAVPNPCRYHWADIMDGRLLLRAAQRRHPLRGGRDLAAVPLQDMHAHGHPLLAAWGRQGRDFVRQLDAFDDVQQARSRFELPRVDLFDEGPGRTLLQQVQACVRDLVPLAEHTAGQGVTVLASDDRSIVFHVAHSAQRELEILHDQLLHLLAHPPGGKALNPRDIVVMVPDIETFAPAIRSVFGQFGRGHPRHIPWGIADQRERGHHPLLVALEWLLRAPQQRFTFSELRDLLEVPAVTRRFDIEADDLPTMMAWIEGAGVRWGLHAAQREQLGLAACGDVNTWHFGLRRMLLGYATGELAAGHAGIEPFSEVAGLSAALAGSLAEVLGVLAPWWAECEAPRAPGAWGARLRSLLQQIFAATDDADRAVLTALDEGLSAWLQACEAAGFDEPVALSVVREAWLEAVDEPGLSRRFKAGGVTFCTLLPMRAIPFEVVCLLGMNDGDYPRRSPRSDFDLMALAGQARPGDRSRRDDDRQLMLDALLSARRVLYISWAGRSQRDNQEQPPSVLVSQLRDYLGAGWGAGVVEARTTEHPLQPFSRRYFQANRVQEAVGVDEQPLFTYAVEWRSVYEDAPVGSAPSDGPSPVPSVGQSSLSAIPMQITVTQLAGFLRNPVKAFFRQRLQVAFEERSALPADDERFVTGGLDRWQLMDEVLSAARLQFDAASSARDTLITLVEGQVARLHRAGRLPMAGPGRVVQAELVATLSPMLAHWQFVQAQHPQVHGKLPLRMQDPLRANLSLDDWLVGLRSSGEAGALPTWIDLQASKLADKKGESARPDKLLKAWVYSLASAACGQPAAGILVGADVVVHVLPLDPAAAQTVLLDLMRACQDGVCGTRPWPTAVLTGLALVKDPTKARVTFEGSDFGGRGEGSEACLGRLYPDFAALSAEPAFETCSQRLYRPYKDWLGTLKIDELPNHAHSDGDSDE